MQTETKACLKRRDQLRAEDESWGLERWDKKQGARMFQENQAAAPKVVIGDDNDSFRSPRAIASLCLC